MSKFGDVEEINKIKQSIIDIENEDIMNTYEVEVDYTEVRYEHKTEILKVRAVDEETAKDEAWYEIEEHIAEGDEVECDNVTIISETLHEDEEKERMQDKLTIPLFPQLVQAKA